MKKTKIICTMGPNTDDKNIMRELAKNGMDVARFNFSHGDHEEHLGRLEVLRGSTQGAGHSGGGFVGYQGTGDSTGLLKDGKKVALKEGQTFTLTTRDVVGDDTITHTISAALMRT